MFAAKNFQFSRSAPTGRIFTISPAVSGKSSWNLDSDGALNLGTAGTWTITPSSSFNMSVKMWGGGAPNAQYNSGAGGAATGTLAVVSGSSYIIRVASTNGGGSASDGAVPGAGYSGIFITSETQANAKIMAGGGGGSDSDDGGRNANGGAGGGTTGQDGQGYSNSYGKGGTQNANGGAGGIASPVNGSNGGALTGGAGGASSGYCGGGGGAGYWGGGGGGMQASWAGGGGGGGSGYIGGVTSGTLYQGNYTTPGNSGDANRGTAGNNGVAGRVYIS